MNKFNIITVIRILKKLIKFIDMAERNRVCRKITKTQHKNTQAACSTIRTIEVLRKVQAKADNTTAQKSKDLAKYLTDLSNA